MSRVVLGIDTSGAAGSVALHPAGAETVFEKGLIHGVALAPAVRGILARLPGGLADVGLVAVGIGPGSYTGVRVGVAFAKTLALAAGIPVVGVCSYDAIAANAPEGATVAVVGDARRGSVYLRVYRRERDHAEPLGPLELAPLEGLGDRLPRGALVLGDATEKFGGILSGGGRTLGETELARCRALAVAALGAGAAAERGPDDVHDLAPLYLRVSEAEERLAERAGRSGGGG